MLIQGFENPHLSVIWSGCGHYIVQLIPYTNTHDMDNSTCACYLIIHKLAPCALRKVVPIFVQNPGFLIIATNICNSLSIFVGQKFQDF